MQLTESQRVWLTIAMGVLIMVILAFGAIYGTEGMKAAPVSQVAKVESLPFTALSAANAEREMTKRGWNEAVKDILITCFINNPPATHSFSQELLSEYREWFRRSNAKVLVGQSCESPGAGHTFILFREKEIGWFAAFQKPDRPMGELTR